MTWHSVESFSAEVTVTKLPRLFLIAVMIGRIRDDRKPFVAAAAAIAAVVGEPR